MQFTANLKMTPQPGMTISKGNIHVRYMYLEYSKLRWRYKIEYRECSPLVTLLSNQVVHDMIESAQSRFDIFYVLKIKSKYHAKTIKIDINKSF